MTSEERSPSGAVVVRTGERELELEYRWHHKLHVYAIVATVVWVLFGLYAAHHNVEIGKSSPADAKLGLVLMLLFAAWWLYVSLAGVLNRTFITIKGGRFRVSHSPLPWASTMDLPVDQLKQFYVQQWGWGQRSRTFRLCVQLADGKKRKVLSGRVADHDLLFIEQTVESHLNITDQPMTEEYS